MNYLQRSRWSCYIATAFLCILPSLHLSTRAQQEPGSGSSSGDTPLLDERDDGIPCPKDHFLFLSNSTCLQCPASCLECLPRVSDVAYPCRVCQRGDGLLLPTRPYTGGGRDGGTDTGGERGSGEGRKLDELRQWWTLGGTCEICQDGGRFETAGTGGLRLNLVGTKQEDGYILEGRLEVLFGGRWGAVCDDGWTQANSDVVCKELGLGYAAGFDKQYDLLHPYLKQMDILMDDLNCTGSEKSVLECHFISASMQNCEATETIGVRCSGPELQGPFCVDRCPRGQFADRTQGICRNCSGRCLACEARGSLGQQPIGSAGVVEEQCTMCQEPYFLIPTNIESIARRSSGSGSGGLLSVGSCVSACPPGFYGNTITRQCQQCAAPCRSCADGISGDHCTSCAADFRLFETTCVAECPPATAVVMLSATSATCQPLPCPAGFYAISLSALTPIPIANRQRGEGSGATGGGVAAELRCAKCNAACRKCWGNASNCTLCPDSHVLQPPTALSILTSGDQEDHGQGGINDEDDPASCLTSCRPGFYPDQDAVCRPCTALNCTFCLPGGRLCARCAPGFFLELGHCIPTCSLGLFPVHDNDVGGSGSSSNSAGRCWYPCPDGFYGNFTTGRCEACAPNCRACISPELCTSCYGSGYLKGGACVKECGAGYLAISFPRRGGLRLLGGGSSTLQGGVEMYQNGLWRQVCYAGDRVKEEGTKSTSHVSPWTLRMANTVCKELQLGTALLATSDGRFSSSQTNLTVALRCYGNESSILDCEHTNYTCLNSELLAVFCSGPDLSHIRECHVTSPVSCDQRGACADSVSCADLPTGGGSRCGPCPLGMHGDGRTCERNIDSLLLSSPEVLMYPISPIEVNFWPEHAQLTLHVVSPAAPLTAADVTWRRDGTVLGNGPLYRLEEWGGLTILNPSGRNASGQYICDISSRSGNASAIYRVSVQEAVRVKVAPRSQTVGSRGTVLNCQGQGHPPPKVTWLKDGKAVQSVSTEVTRQGTLILRDVRAEDAGVYACVLTNGFSRATVYANVTVDAPARIAKKSAYSTAIEGRNFSINCDAIGGPTPVVYWKRDGENLPNNHRTKVAGTKLIISDVEESDTGVYRCVASNRGGSDVWKTNMTVLVPPKATITPEVRSVTTGTTVRFRCLVTGRPLPIVTWFLRHHQPGGAAGGGGAGHQQSQAEVTTATTAVDDNQVSVDGDVSELVLNTVTPEVSGHVICHAQNEAGIMRVIANLTVLGPPQWVVAPSDVWALNQWPAVLPWGAYASPEVEQVWFRDGLELRASQRYDIREDGLFFNAQYPSDSGTYTLQASNSQGVLVASAHMEIVRDLAQPEVRHVTPTNITLHTGSLPSEVKAVTFEILVVRAGFNDTRENLTTSPLDVITRDPQEYMRSNITDTSEGYITLVFDRLPRTLTIGDGKRYASAATKRSVLNVPLLAGYWYAVTVRLIRYSHYREVAPGPPWTAAMFPVGASNYTVVLTGVTGSFIESGSDGSMQTAAGVILGIVLCLILVTVAFIVFYWQRNGQVSCLSFDHFVLLGRIIKERTLSTTEYISKFGPHPGSGQFKPEPFGGGAKGTSSETISTSVSTVYIPTEDEIDSLESIGIHYYDDDNWMSRVPSGVLSVGQSPRPLSKNSRYPQLSLSSEPLPSTSKDESSGYLHRTWSEPSLQPTSPSAHRRTVYRQTLLERTNSDSALSHAGSAVPTDDGIDMQGTSRNCLIGDQEVGKNVKLNELKSVRIRVLPEVQKMRHVDNPKKARFSDYTDDAAVSTKKLPSKLQKIGSNLKLKSILAALPSKNKKWKASEIPEVSEDTGTAASSTASTPKKIIRTRRRRPRIKHFKNLRDKGLRSLRDRGSHLWLQGRKWAKHVLDRHDAYGIQKSEDSDSSTDGKTSDSEAEQKKFTKRPKKSESDNVVKTAAKRTRTNSSNKDSDGGSGDLDCVYIDPSSIVSIPLRKIYSSGKSAPKATIKAMNSFPVSGMKAREASITSILPQDLEQFRPKAETIENKGKANTKRSSRKAKTVTAKQVQQRPPAKTSKHESNEDGSPVVIKMIGKLRHRKDAVVQTDSELDDDNDFDESESTIVEQHNSPGTVEVIDNSNIEKLQFTVELAVDSACDDATPKPTKRRDIDEVHDEEIEEAKSTVDDVVEDNVLEDAKPEISSLRSIDGNVEEEAMPHDDSERSRRPTSSSSDNSQKNESSNESSDYLELLASEMKSQDPLNLNGVVRTESDANKDPDIEGDIYQSLSSFDASIVRNDTPPNLPLRNAGAKEAMDEKCDHEQNTSNPDVESTPVHISHNDSLILHRQSPRRSLKKSHFVPVHSSSLTADNSSSLLNSKQHVVSGSKLDPDHVSSSELENNGSLASTTSTEKQSYNDSGFHAEIQSVTKKVPPKKLVIPDVFKN